MKTFQIITTEEEKGSYINLDTTNKTFSFKLQTGDSIAEGMCQLSDSETEAFSAVFGRMVANVTKKDHEGSTQPTEAAHA